MEINVADHVGPAFDAVFQDIIHHRHTHYWMKGGRGSTKSSFVSVMLPILLLQNPKCHAVVLRKVGNTIKTSVYPQVLWGIDAMGLNGLFSAKISPPEITLKHTGQKIYFMGDDDPMKLKSIKPPFGYIGVVWFEEFDQFAGMEGIRNLNQSLLRGGDKYWEFCSFNPPKSRNNWVNEEQLYDDADRLIHHSTYLQVPKEWLGSQFLLEAEKLKGKNLKSYEHEYLGKVTGTGGAVFENVEDLRMSNEMIAQFDRLHCGLDFGFAVDPLAFVQMHYDAKKEELYIFDEVYQQKLTNRAVAQILRAKHLTAPIIADSAEPKSIAEIRDMGFNIIGCRKGPDSVAYGIKWLQERRKIYIDKRRCPNTYREFTCYEYERNRQGQFISAYPDADNHAIDATRYACQNEMARARVKILRR